MIIREILKLRKIHEARKKREIKLEEIHQLNEEMNEMCDKYLINSKIN